MNKKTNQFLIKLENTEANVPVISKGSALNAADKIYYNILENGESALSYAEMFSFVGEIEDILKKKEDDNGKNKFADLVRDEIQKSSDDGKSVTTKFGTKFSLAETGTKYSFDGCGDPEWDSLDKEIAPLLLKKKEREEFLKKLKSPLDVLDKTSGEIITIHPPVKTSTSSFKKELLKD